MIPFNPYCPAKAMLDTCPAPRFPFFEMEEPGVSSTLQPSTPDIFAASLGAMLLQNPQVCSNLLSNLVSPWYTKFLELLRQPKKQPKAGTVLIEPCKSYNKPHWHSYSVREVFKNTVARYLPRSKGHTQPGEQPIQILCANIKDINPALPRNPEDVPYFQIDQFFTNIASEMIKTIDQVAEDGETDVVIVTSGQFRIRFYQIIKNLFTTDPEWFAPLNKEIRKQLKPGDTGPDTLRKINREIMRFVDEHLDSPNSAYQQFKAKYQKVIKEAAEKGVAVVVASGNEHHKTNNFPDAKLGADMNFLMEAEDIIGVGAFDDGGTTSPDDDKVALFSSWGTGKHNPTVLAPGVNINTGEVKKRNGTSFAAPYAAAVIRAMRQANPNLSVEETIEILQTTATKIKGSKKIAQGAGRINPELAIQEAKRRNEQFSLG